MTQRYAASTIEVSIELWNHAVRTMKDRMGSAEHKESVLKQLQEEFPDAISSEDLAKALSLVEERMNAFRPIAVGLGKAANLEKLSCKGGWFQSPLSKRSAF